MLRKMLGGILPTDVIRNLRLSQTNTYMNTYFAKQNYVIESYGKMSPNFSQYLRDKICQQLELNYLSEEEKEEKLKDVKGIYIHYDTPSSKRLSETLCENSSFKRFLVNNYSNIKMVK